MNKQILIVKGSPRKNGNTAAMADSFAKGASDFGRPEITLHKLRHTCCSLLINKGWPIKQLQYWLGHDDVQTTLNIYAHYNRKLLNQSTNDLEDISAGTLQLFK